MQADGDKDDSDNQRVHCEDGQVEDDAHAAQAPVFLVLMVTPNLCKANSEHNHWGDIAYSRNDVRIQVWINVVKVISLDRIVDWLEQDKNAWNYNLQHFDDRFAPFDFLFVDLILLATAIIVLNSGNSVARFKIL